MVSKLGCDKGIWWGTEAPDGKSINSLTAQTLTDLGAGSTFHNTRIRIAPLPQNQDKNAEAGGPPV